MSNKTKTLDVAIYLRDKQFLNVQNVTEHYVEAGLLYVMSTEEAYMFPIDNVSFYKTVLSK